MCGILGSVNKRFDQNLLESINHRGPDSSGIKDYRINVHDIILGMTRLAILDLSEAGAQPMTSSCGKFAIIFNGEIYNHHDLRNKLSEFEFNGHSDTETILYYLLKFGVDGVRDFNGIFGFSFLDIENQKLFIVRDPFGVKPVYYCHSENELIFSSEIRPIKQLANHIQLDKENLSTLLFLRYLPSPLTLHATIKKLRPGHYLEVDLSLEILTLKEHYFVKNEEKTLKRTKSETLKAYGSFIEEAVKRQLLSDVEVGILLSGGIDSAVIAALAQKHSSKKLKAFTIGFVGDNKEDEIERAEESAKLLGLEHFSKKLDFHDFLSLIKETTRIIEKPLATTSVIPMYYLSQLASKHVRVVLSGQGADELLGGYTKYQGEIISQMIPRSLISISSKIIPFLGVKNEQILRASSSLGEYDEVQRFLNVYSIFSQKEIVQLLNSKENKAYDLVSYYHNILKSDIRKKSVERMMALDLRMNLADDLLLYTDKITMNFSLECRVPMLDTELVKYIESLLAHERVSLGKTKIIHKNFASKILPERIIKRKKMAFQSPTNVWFIEHSNQIKDLLLNQSLFSEIFDAKAVNNILDQHLNGYNREKQIFLLLGIYYWLELND